MARVASVVEAGLPLLAVTTDAAEIRKASPARILGCISISNALIRGTGTEHPLVLLFTRRGPRENKRTGKISALSIDTPPRSFVRSFARLFSVAAAEGNAIQRNEMLCHPKRGERANSDAFPAETRRDKTVFQGRVHGYVDS